MENEVIKTAIEAIKIVSPIPSRILSPNCMIGSIRGRFAKASAAKKYRKIVKESIEEIPIETAPWQKVQVRVEFYYKTRRKRDVDNAIAALKSAYDGIVDSGLAIDDDPLHMERQIPTFRIDRNCPRVEMVITNIEELE